MSMMWLFIRLFAISIAFKNVSYFIFQLDILFGFFSHLIGHFSWFPDSHRCLWVISLNMPSAIVLKTDLLFQHLKALHVYFVVVDVVVLFLQLLEQSLTPKRVLPDGNCMVNICWLSKFMPFSCLCILGCCCLFFV